jgi:hypothetical protein
MESKVELPPSYEEVVKNDSDVQKHYEELIALQKETIESLKRQLELKDKKEKKSGLERKTSLIRYKRFEEREERIQKKKEERMREKEYCRKYNIKKNISTYFFFAQEKRDEVKKDNPLLNCLEISKKLQNMWRVVRETEEAVKYIKLAKKDKERYLAELKYYRESNKFLSDVNCMVANV